MEHDTYRISFRQTARLSLALPLLLVAPASCTRPVGKKAEPPQPWLPTPEEQARFQERLRKSMEFDHTPYGWRAKPEELTRAMQLEQLLAEARLQGKALLVALMPKHGPETAKRRAWIELLLQRANHEASRELALFFVFAATPQELQRILQLAEVPPEDALYAFLAPEQVPGGDVPRAPEPIFLSREWMRGLDPRLDERAPDSYQRFSGEELLRFLSDPDMRDRVSADEAWIPTGRGYFNSDGSYGLSFGDDSLAAQEIYDPALAWEKATHARLVAGLRELRKRAGYDLKRASRASQDAIGSAQPEIDSWLRAEDSAVPPQVLIGAAQALARVEDLAEPQRSARSEALAAALAWDRRFQLARRDALFRVVYDDIERPCHACGMAMMDLRARRFTDLLLRVRPASAPATSDPEHGIEARTKHETAPPK